MNDFGQQERDIQEEFGKWVAVCYLSFSFLFFFIIITYSAGGEREKKMGREWKGANLWEIGGGD